MTEQERLQELQRRERARSARAYPASEGPPMGSVLQGQRGVPEDVPLEHLTPEQRKAVDYSPYGKGVPRLPRSGINAWDGSINDGQGGYVPRAPSRGMLDATDDWHLQGEHGLQMRARAFGIDPAAYGPEAMPKLEADVAAAEKRHERLTQGGKYTIEDLPGGGQRYKPGKPMIDWMEGKKREDALRTLAKRFHHQINADRNGDGRPDFTVADLEAAYDDKALDGKSHVERMRAVNSGLVGQWRTDRDMDVAETLSRRRAQNALAQRLNTSVANVMFHDDLMNAKTPEDRIRVLLAYHAQNPNLGMGNMAAYIQRGMDEASAMEAMEARERAKAVASNPVDQIPLDMQKVDAMPLGLPRIEARRAAVRRQHKDGVAPPGAVEDAIINGEVDSVRRMASQRGLSAGDREHLREWTAAFLSKHKGKTGRGEFEEWSKFLGITPWSPQSKRLWREATGKNIEEKNYWLMPDSMWPPYWFNDPRNIPDPGA